MVRFARICVAALYAMGAVNTSIVWLSHDVYHAFEGVTFVQTFRANDLGSDGNAPNDAHNHIGQQHSHNTDDHAHGHSHKHDQLHGDERARSRSDVHSHRHSGDERVHGHTAIVDLLLAAEENRDSTDRDHATVLNATGLDLHLVCLVQLGATLALVRHGQRTAAKQFADELNRPDTPPPRV